MRWSGRVPIRLGQRAAGSGGPSWGGAQQAVQRGFRQGFGVFQRGHGFGVPMAQNLGDRSGGVRSGKVQSSSAAGRGQDAGGSVQAGAFNWAGIGQIRKHTLKP